MLLIGNDIKKSFEASDVARFTNKDVDGLLKDGSEILVYVSVTAPPIHFGCAYQKEK